VEQQQRRAASRVTSVDLGFARVDPGLRESVEHGGKRTHLLKDSR
jgi:hypothetical protein